MKSDNIPKSIDEYIASYPENIREKLRAMRLTVRKAAPDASERISYRMPAYAFNGMLVYFAAHTNHLGLYPFTSAIQAFSKDLAPYRQTKGGIRFPYSSPLPLDLIKRIVEFRVQENLHKAALKKVPAIKQRSKT